MKASTPKIWKMYSRTFLGATLFGTLYLFLQSANVENLMGPILMAMLIITILSRQKIKQSIGISKEMRGYHKWLMLGMAAYIMASFLLAGSYLTYDDHIPFKYGWRLRTGEDPSVVVNDLCRDYMENRIGAGLHTFETALKICPDNTAAKQVIEHFNSWKKSGPSRGEGKP